MHPQLFNLQLLPCTINGDGLTAIAGVPQSVLKTTSIKSENIVYTSISHSLLLEL
jgi:hypothetical protein